MSPVRSFVLVVRRRRGLSLAEVVMSTFLVGLVMVAALQSVGSAAKTWTSAAELADGHALAQQLLGEMLALPYEDAATPGDFGPEAGDVVAAGVRTGLDDLDDYVDWSDTPPKDAAGAALAGYAGWQRTADVQKINSTSHAALVDVAPDEGLRRVTVTVVSPTGRTASLTSLRAAGGGCLQLQGVQQSLVTWVGASLQAGDGSAVIGGTVVENHASDQ